MRFDSAAGSVVGASRFAVSIVEEKEMDHRDTVLDTKPKERRVFHVNKANVGPVTKFGLIKTTGDKYCDN